MSIFAELQERACADFYRPESQKAPAPQKTPTPAPPVASPPVLARADEPTSPDPASGTVSATPPAMPPQPGIQALETPSAAPAPSAHIPPPPEPEAAVAKDTAQATDDGAGRKAHEEAEARRRAEWEAGQAAKEAARQEQLARIAAMGEAELLAASVKRVTADTERLTRRNMKEAVAEHISSKCREKADFARLVMHPAKTMVNCFQYINRKAQEYAEQEMKDNGIERRGVYGLDVPDGLCYQWAEDYFNDSDALEDHKDEEKFTPKPYVGADGKASKAKPDKKPKTDKKTSPEEKKDSSGDGMYEQLTLEVMK